MRVKIREQENGKIDPEDAKLERLEGVRKVHYFNDLVIYILECVIFVTRSTYGCNCVVSNTGN